MKLWWTNFVKDYLTFSKKERRGIFVLLLLCMLIFLLSRYFPVPEKHLEKNTFQKELAQLTISIDTSHTNYRNNQEDFAENTRPAAPAYSSNAHHELFEFDPNTLSAEGWTKLGLRDKTIHTIQNFLAKGFRFRQANDIRKIYGLSTNDANRLVAYVKIADDEGKKTPRPNNYKPFAAKVEEAKPRNSVIDINSADTSEFISLPGIGSKLAARIVNFRQKLGGFTSVKQVGETYGIADSTFEMIKGRLRCVQPQVKRININTADASELKGHPYIRWNIANAIVHYRTQHGLYTSVEELKKIEIITDEVFEKIAPYLSCNNN